MMPEMDGIETTAAIRKLEMRNEELGKSGKQIPIIALTANAVVGMREMFIKNGFNDFLSKPIDVGKLDEILDKWIPEDKRANNNEQITNNKEEQNKLPDKNAGSSLLFIPGIDVQKGITMTGGTVSAYNQVLSLFCKDAEDRLPLLQKAPEADALSALVTHVHALKSASASIGAQEISNQAAGLEAAGKAGDVDFIRKNLPSFARQLAELVKEIDAALKTDKNGGGMANNGTAGQAAETARDFAALVPLLGDLESALEAQKSAEIDRLLEELNQKPLDKQTREALNKISDDVLMAEFESAVKIAGELRAQGASLTNK